MENPTTFVYNCSAKENSEVQAIRNKYLSHEESKLEELKRLDNTVQFSGMVESLSTGIGGALIFGHWKDTGLRLVRGRNAFVYDGVYDYFFGLYYN